MPPTEVITPRQAREILALRKLQQSPWLYAQEILGVYWWQSQRDIAAAMMQHRRVLVKASHSVGKTHLAAGIVNWHYDMYDPSETLTTAPTKQQVIDALWKEIRRQRMGRPGLQPKEPRMESSADHYAVGYTADSGGAFQGRHSERILIVFDECVDVGGEYWEAAEGMMTGESRWLAICNPTDTSSPAYAASLDDQWHCITVSALDHPNIAAELAGEPLVVRDAVNLEWVEGRVEAWCNPLAGGDALPTDLEWPPNSGNWYRPGPEFESRVLGRWPTSGSDSVWSEAAWNAACIQQPIPQVATVIGCDVARFGDDYTSIVVRRGPCVLHHETHNGWSTGQTAGRLKELCRQWKQPGEDPRGIDCYIDDDGVGGGVTDAGTGWKFHGCSGSGRPNDVEKYPNRRSEVWFVVAQRAVARELDVSRLSKASQELLRKQAMAPRWKLDGPGRRVVERKDETKKRLKRSPDDMDALNLSMAHAPSVDLGWLDAAAVEGPLISDMDPDIVNWLCPGCGQDPHGMTEVARYDRMENGTELARNAPIHCDVCLCASVILGPNRCSVGGWYRLAGEGDSDGSL